MNEMRHQSAAARGRIEDRRFITGQGRYADDRRPAGSLHAVFVRSMHAHGTLRTLDVAAALEMPGVAAVFTAADLERAGIGPLRSSIPYKRRGEAAALETPRPLLVDKTVRHLGEAVAMVLAESRTEAVDAAEAVLVEIDDHPAASDLSAALSPQAESVWPEAADNVAFHWSGGDGGRAREAIAGAAHIAELDTMISRVTAAAMEPRCAVAEPQPDGRLILRTGTQHPFALRDEIESLLDLRAGDLRVLVEDVGGSFGMKSGTYGEDVLLVFAARQLGRPVAWRADRAESFLSDCHGRDVHVRARLGLDEDGRFLGLEVSYRLNIGAYVSRRSLAPINNIGGVAGMYRIGAIGAEARGILTHSVPVAPYRGAGRPEATYTIERLIDIAAGRMGLDRFDLRRRNLVPPEAMPYNTGLTFEYDVGDFPALVEAARIRADLDGFAARRERSLEAGRLRGLGIANPIEVAGGPFGSLKPDHARMSLRADGTMDLAVGALSTGQGQETVLSRLAAEALGLPLTHIHFLQGDTDALPDGRGTGGSAGAPTAAPTILSVSRAFVETGRDSASRHLEADAADIEYKDGVFSIAGTDRSLDWQELFQVAEPQNLLTNASFAPANVTYPYGSHIVEVEIDPLTGVVTVDRYAAIEDVGNPIDPVLVEGQMQGGIAQGLGQALGEAIVFDEAGQMLTSSFLDYQMPRACDVPAMDLSTRNVPSPANPLGAKGVGEAGTVGSLAAISNAIVDALSPFGIDHVEMPATPHRIWAAIEAARRKGAAADAPGAPPLRREPALSDSGGSSRR